MPDKLSIYNGAQTVLGQREITALAENIPARLEYDKVWNNEFIDRVLQMGQWNFATRTIKLEADPSITTEFGYQFAFPKADDFIRTVGVASDEYFAQPLTQYNDEARVWFADIQTLYIRYVSNDIEFGGDLSLWPGNFSEMVEHYLAYKASPKITGVTLDSETLERRWQSRKLEAKSTDAMESPTKFPPKGNWASARQGFGTGERGNRNQLIG